jgi:hypothetical protein
MHRAKQRHICWIGMEFRRRICSKLGVTVRTVIIESKLWIAELG